MKLDAEAVVGIVLIVSPIGFTPSPSKSWKTIGSDMTYKSLGITPYLMISKEKSQLAVAVVLPVTVKLPSARVTIQPVSVASKDMGVIMTMSTALHRAEVTTVDEVPVAIAAFPAQNLMPTGPGVPVLSSAATERDRVRGEPN